MAVVNETANKIEFPQGPLFTGGAEKVIQKVISIASGDDDGSKYLVGEIPGEAIITGLSVINTAVTSGTDYDIGIADQAGTILDADILVDGASMASARTLFTELALAFGAANAAKAIYEHVQHVQKVKPASGETAAKAAYRIIMTANTVGSDDGTVVVQVRYRDSI